MSATISIRGQANFEALDEARQNGDLPPGTRIGPQRQSPYGWYPQPDNAVGTLQTGYKTSFWLIADKKGQD